MKKYFQAAIIGFTLIHVPVMAEEIRQLTWENLIPAHLLAEDPIARLSQNLQEMVYRVMDMLGTLQEIDTQAERENKELDAAISILKKNGIDIKKVVAKQKEIRTAVVKALDGKRVRLPGYLLPLEVSDAKVTEFLLVPYVGACIHVPPPPPNQIVYVKTAPHKGYKSKNIFDLVWVTGKMSIVSVTKDLFLVDGSKGISAGYNLKAEKIEPYRK